MAPVLISHNERSLSEQGPDWDPAYATEPLYIHSSLSEMQADTSKKSKRIEKTKPYLPGAMLSESALVAPCLAAPLQQFGIPPLCEDMMSHTATATTVASTNDAHDSGAESDCSTADTSREATTSFDMGQAASDGQFMMHSMGFMEAQPWPAYSASSYWMPYQPQSWPQLPSMGSAGHRLGRCKPCAFLHKDGCRSGSDCPYCHLCPPGEKQRRKRVMRAMQRNMGPPGLQT